MRKIALFVFNICYLNVNIFAQDIQKIELEKGCKLLEAISVNNGLVLKTGQEYYYRKNRLWKLKFYNADLSLRYEIPLLKSSIYNRTDIIASQTGDNVYHIEYSTLLLQSKYDKLTITHVDSSGFASNGLIRNQFKFNNLQAIFADDNFLYFLTNEKVKVPGNRKKASR